MKKSLFEIFFMSLLGIMLCSLPALGGQESPTGPDDELLSVEFRDGLFTIHAKKVSLGRTIAEMEKRSGFSIVIDEELKSRMVTLDISGQDILKTILHISEKAELGGYGATFEGNGSGTVVIAAKKTGMEKAKATRGAIVPSAEGLCFQHDCSPSLAPGAPIMVEDEALRMTEEPEDIAADDNSQQEAEIDVSTPEIDSSAEDAGSPEPFSQPQESDCDYLSPGDPSYCIVCGRC